MLDLLFSFATTVTLAGDKPYTRPRVQDSEQCTLAIKQARHPILDSIAADKVVPRDDGALRKALSDQQRRRRCDPVACIARGEERREQLEREQRAC